MKIGIFGGSFDPVHMGHLILAEFCREAGGLDEIWFVPAATSPHKPEGSVATKRQRLEMLQLAIGGHPAFVLSRLEIDRGEISYTVDTLDSIHQQSPGSELFLLLGADNLESFSTWKDPQRVCELATPLVMARRTHDPVVEPLRSLVHSTRFAEIEAAQLHDWPLIEISSTEIRRRARSGRSIRYLTPAAVGTYIQVNQVYVETAVQSSATP